MDLKKLYLLLIILIVLYVGINVNVNGFDILNSTGTADSDNGGAQAGNIVFPKIDAFSMTNINDTAVKYVNNNTNITIIAQAIDNSINISQIHANSSNNGYTSNQVIDQNGVTTYFLYKEEAEYYSSDIYFTKDNQSFKLSGKNIPYENSDLFINACKKIIDTIKVSSSSSSKNSNDLLPLNN